MHRLFRLPARCDHWVIVVGVTGMTLNVAGAGDWVPEPVLLGEAVPGAVVLGALEPGVLDGVVGPDQRKAIGAGGAHAAAHGDGGRGQERGPCGGVVIVAGLE